MNKTLDPRRYSIGERLDWVVESNEQDFESLFLLFVQSDIPLSLVRAGKPVDHSTVEIAELLQVREKILELAIEWEAKTTQDLAFKLALWSWSDPDRGLTLDQRTPRDMLVLSCIEDVAGDSRSPSMTSPMILLPQPERDLVSRQRADFAQHRKGQRRRNDDAV